MPSHLIAQDGPLQGLVLEFDQKDEWIVGRDPEDADFVVEDPTVSKKHARIEKTDEGVFIRNLSRMNPTLVNDEPFEGSVLLKEGDKVKIGDTQFLFSEQAIPAGAKRPKKSGYDDIFGDLEEPELPPEPEPVETSIEQMVPEEPSKPSHDTIFESSEEPAEAPFNLLSDTPLLLKVISGPNAGAEIGLEKGRSYVIGKDPASCDIVFQDLSVSRNHAKLSISPDGILELEDLGSKNKTVVNHAPIADKQAITAQDLISMGTTVFLIIDREAAQETIFSPVFPVVEEAKVPEEEPGAQIPAAAEPAIEEADWKSRKIPTKYLIAVSAFAAMFLVAALTFFSLFKSEKIEITQKTPLSEIEHALAKFPGVQFSFNPAGGKLFVTGHVLSAIEHREMEFNLAQIHSIVAIEDTVIIDEYVWKTMNDVLNDNPLWRSVSIVAPKPGQFLAHGYVKTTEDMSRLSDYLNVNFPYIDRLQNQVVAEDALATEIQGMLLSKGFGAVAFQLAAGEVVLAGRYSEQMEPEYKKLVAEINKLPGIQGIKNFAVASSPSQASVDLTEQYKITGMAEHDTKGYSAVINGRIYTIGDKLDSMTITEINPSIVLLEKDGLKYKIDYIR